MPSKPSLLSKKQEKLSLSGQFLSDLLQAVLDKGARFRFQAGGSSMSPFIKDGDTVTVSPLAGHPPGIGDVVAFIDQRNNRKLVVHRLIGQTDGSCLVKGDNAPEPDGMIATSSILGYVTKVERGEKRIYLGLGSERVLIALLTRTGLLRPFLSRVWRRVRPLFR